MIHLLSLRESTTGYDSRLVILPASMEKVAWMRGFYHFQNVADVNGWD